MEGEEGESSIVDSFREEEGGWVGGWGRGEGERRGRGEEAMGRKNSGPTPPPPQASSPPLPTAAPPPTPALPGLPLPNKKSPPPSLQEREGGRHGLAVRVVPCWGRREAWTARARALALVRAANTRQFPVAADDAHGDAGPRPDPLKHRQSATLAGLPAPILLAAPLLPAGRCRRTTPRQPLGGTGRRAAAGR
jgi:hypothetical protein